MLLSSRSRNVTTMTLVLTLAGVLVTSPAEAGQKTKKKQKKKQPQSQTAQPTASASSGPAGLAKPPPAVVSAGKHLLAYDTEAARRAIEGSSTDNAWVATVKGRILLAENEFESAAAECRRAAKLGRKDILYNDLDRFVKMAPEAPEAANARQILNSFS